MISKVRGKFTDVSRDAGVADPSGAFGLGIAWFDANDDGWPDLYVANDVSDNVLFRNLGNGRFEDVSGRFPRIAWRTPDQAGTAVRIERLETRAFIWETPADVRRLEGTLTVRDSLIAFELPRVRLPDSELAVTGRMVVGAGDALERARAAGGASTRDGMEQGA